VSNTWATCPGVRNNPGKPGLIPDDVEWGHPRPSKGTARCRPWMGPRAIS